MLPGEIKKKRSSSLACFILLGYHASLFPVLHAFCWRRILWLNSLSALAGNSPRGKGVSKAMRVSAGTRLESQDTVISATYTETYSMITGLVPFNSWDHSSKVATLTRPFSEMRLQYVQFHGSFHIIQAFWFHSFDLTYFPLIAWHDQCYFHFLEKGGGRSCRDANVESSHIWLEIWL